MKKLMIAAALMAATVSANAQQPAGSFSLQPKVGMTIATVTDFHGDAKIGLVAGVEGMYQVSEKFGISAGLVYAMQGTKYDVEVLEKEYTAKLNNDYLNIPILANYYVAPGLAIKAGIQPGFLMSSKLKVEDNSTSVKDLYESFDFSIPVGLSYEFSDFVIDARYNWGVTNIVKDAKDSYKNSVFNITVGYKFAL